MSTDERAAEARLRLDVARKFACGWTSRWGKIACPGSDGKGHSNICDSLTYSLDDLLQVRERETTAALAAVQVERDEARALLNTPEVLDFVKAVQLEAAHQRARWGAAHDDGKTDADSFWLIGYLGGKALHNPGGERDKQLHRIVTVAAAAANWHAAKLGATNMRPGIETPKGEAP